MEIKYYFESLTAWKAACDYFNLHPRASAQEMADATSMNFRIAKKYRTIWKLNQKDIFTPQLGSCSHG
jgi:hypothetical protein